MTSKTLCLEIMQKKFHAIKSVFTFFVVHTKNEFSHFILVLRRKFLFMLINIFLLLFSHMHRIKGNLINKTQKGVKCVVTIR